MPLNLRDTNYSGGTNLGRTLTFAELDGDLIYLNERVNTISASLPTLYTAGLGIEINNGAISASLRTVNGILPTNGNVAVALTSTRTGNSASLILSSSGANTSSLIDGTVWIISGDGDPNNNGDSYIWSSGSQVWFPINTTDQTANDARYLKLTPQQSLSGSLNLGGYNITNVGTISASLGITGSLQGTASWAVSASQAISSSRSFTSSYTLDFDRTGLITTGSSSTIQIVSGTLNLTGSLNVTGALYISSSLNINSASFNYQQNLTVNSGSYRVISSTPTASYKAAFFDYLMFSGSNSRAGHVQSVWSGSSIEYNEIATNDLGTTAGVTLRAAISGSNIQLQATASSDSWTIRSLVRLL
jgi:hypothetical protein